MKQECILLLYLSFTLLNFIESSFIPSDLSTLSCNDIEKLNKYLEERRMYEEILVSRYADITSTENLTLLYEMEDVKENSFDVIDILPKNQSLYLKRRPPTVCGKPATAVYHITVLALDSINESSMTYSADIYLAIAWVDHRLRFPNSARKYLLLDPDWLQKLWRPDTIFRNAREVTFHDKVVPNHYLVMLPTKALVYVTKLTLILTCAMDFKAYPHDTQECDIRIESMIYTIKELNSTWDAKKPMLFNTKRNLVQTPQYKSVHNRTTRCEVDYGSGTYACIKAVFYFRRRLGYHMIHTYFPSGFIVILSWLTFWIKPRDIAARIGLGVTSLLTLVTLNTQSQELLPPVSYGKAIDTWMCSCALFVFCSILEFAIVNYLVCRFPVDPEENEITEKEKKKGLLRIFTHERIQLLAHNIDRFSRIFFPTSFILLNVWYFRRYIREDRIEGVEVESE